MLDHGFECEGFTVVRGPDPLWGGDVRRFTPPSGRFDGIVGGDPCQSHSKLAHLVRAKGLEPSFPDLTSEFARIVLEAQPRWFLRENVPQATDIQVPGFHVTSFVLDNCWLGEVQRRKRRFWFGWDRDEPAPNLRRWIPGAALEVMESVNAVAGDPRQSFIPGGQAEVDAIRAARVKETSVGGHDGTADALGDKTYRAKREAAGKRGASGHDIPKRDLARMLELQGFPPDWLDHQPWTMVARRKMVGNGVPLPMGRAVAHAIKQATSS
jgi:DNA (cytosine-5)-methyltransferase 1